MNIKKLTLADGAEIDDCAVMLREMYKELKHDKASDNISVYKDMILDYIIECDVLYYVGGRGFFVMKDESVPALPKQKMWNGVAVYIRPEYRKTSVYKEMVDYMFENYKGTIMGYTEKNSNHNNILLKRHKLLGYVYEMVRR